MSGFCLDKELPQMVVLCLPTDLWVSDLSREKYIFLNLKRFHAYEKTKKLSVIFVPISIILHSDIEENF